MRDLEIRGAGNLLGSQQHGHIVTVGYDVYTRLVEKTVAELRGETVERPPLESGPKIDLVCGAHLCEDHIPDLQQRLSLYRRISSLSTDEEADTLTREIDDRFGSAPPSVVELLHLGRLKSRVSRIGVTLIREIPGRLVVQANDLEAIDRFVIETALPPRPIDPHTVHLLLPETLPEGGSLALLSRASDRCFQPPTNEGN